MRNIFTVIVSLLMSYLSIAQPPAGGGNRPANGRTGLTGTFYGKIVEAKTSKPIEYASVQLLQSRMDSVTKTRKDVVIGGMLTKTNGEFILENVPVFGQMKLKVSVVGFLPYEQVVSFDRPAANSDGGNMMAALDKDLGNIKIDIAEKMLENVTVTAERSGLQLGIDRKVFNVDKNLVSAGGTAVDVMKNVPSVSVDIDGNVTMRNNSPQIFVDGRPTTMTLDQIPADAIESIEIITNPSAKFDASGGTSGILNVVLKKAKRVGYSGSVRTNIDSRGRFGLGTDLNVRQDKINFFVNGNYNQRKSISSGYTDRLTFGNPNVNFRQDDKSTQTGSFMFLRTGFDLFLNNRNTLSLTGNIGRGRFKPFNESGILIDTLFPTPSSKFIDRSTNSTNEFNNGGAMLSFKHNFPKQGEEFTADVTFNKSKSTNSLNIFNDTLSAPGGTMINSYNERQIGNGGNQNLVMQADYSKPINDHSKFEIGARTQIRKIENVNNFYSLNGSTPVLLPAFSANYNSTDKIYAAYATYSNRIKGFGYQLGLRAESSNYVGRLPDKNEIFEIDFPISFFPSVFLSQKIGADQDLQLNYTRRINRPNFFQLNPQFDRSDALNISIGNPNLKPEFTNSLELSYQKTFKNRDNFIASIYYKNTNDLITRSLEQATDPVTNENYFINSYVNANSSFITGLELVSKNKITKWWDLTSNVSLFTSKIDLEDPTKPEQDQFASWFGKLNNTFKLPKNFTIQLSGEYQSKTVLPPGGSGGGGRGGGGGGFGGGGFGGGGTTAQGYIRANYYVDGGIRYEFMKNKTASISLNVNDIFRTRRQFIHSEDITFVQDVFRRRDPQIFRLNFNWRFGKFDANLFKRKNNRNPGSDGSENLNLGQ